MTYQTRKQYLSDYRRRVAAAMAENDRAALRAMYDRAHQEYNDQIKINQLCMTTGVKIDKIMTHYIIDQYQIISDALVYGITPEI